MYKIGDLVAYQMVGICEIKDIIIADFVGTEKEYYVLEEIDNTKSVLKIPVDNCTKMRPIMTREALDHLFDNLLKDNEIKTVDRRAKNAEIDALFTENSLMDLISVIQTIYKDKIRRQEDNKALSSQHRTKMDKAKKLLFQEMAIVLEISGEDAEKYFIEQVQE